MWPYPQGNIKDNRLPSWNRPVLVSDAMGQSSSRIQRLAAYFLAWLMILLGPAMATWGVWFLVEAYTSTSWPSVSGEIARVDVKRQLDDGDYVLRVTYRYVVDGRVHLGQRNNLGDGLSVGGAYDTAAIAQAAGAERYPVGSAIEVYYDPDDPANALMSPGARWPTWVPLILGLLFFPAGLALRKGLQLQDSSSPAR